jgi:hypothetical protein
MIGLPAGTRVWLVAGHTDMRKAAAAWRSLPRSCRCCSKALIGGCRFAPMRLG